MSSTEPTGVDLDAARALIAVCRWTYAKTVPEAPHEYCLRAWLSPDHQADFDWFVRRDRRAWLPGPVLEAGVGLPRRGRPEVLGVPDPGREWRDHQPGSPGGGDGLALQHTAGAVAVARGQRALADAFEQVIQSVAVGAGCDVRELGPGRGQVMFHRQEAFAPDCSIG